MSSDNGIFVLQSPNSLTGNIEYRVAYASAIENINYFQEGTDLFFAMEVVVFGKSHVHTNEINALKEALSMQEKIGLTEYGICMIPKRNYAFSTMSQKDAQEMLKAF